MVDNLSNFLTISDQYISKFSPTTVGNLSAFLAILHRCTSNISTKKWSYKGGSTQMYVEKGYCPIGELSDRGIVRSGNCPVGELSGRGIVQSGNCPVGELSGRGIVLSGNCPVGELSGRGTVR